MPKYLKLPSRKWNGKSDIAFKLRLSKVSKERLFFYLCTLRNIAEHPRIVQLTNYLIENVGMEPLMAYVMAHTSDSGGFYGHAAIAYDNKVQAERMGGVYVVKPRSLINYTIKLHRFLTQKTVPYVTELKNSKYSAWYLDRAVNKTKHKAKIPRSTLSNVHNFSSKTRTLIEA